MVQLKEKIIQKFGNNEDDSDNAWSNFLRYQYYYNSNDFLINENLAEWNENNWENDSFVYNYVYDANGNLIEKNKAKKEGSKTRIVNKESFVFNANQQLEEQLISDWDSRKKTWIEKYTGNL